MKMPGHKQNGAALLAAMITVSIVASIASAAIWMQWRQVEIEIAERGRDQTRWLMTGAFDWTRLILSEDARTSSAVDHLGEPWAIPVEESKLSTFLAQDKQWREGDPEVYLSGAISDAQGRLNLTSLSVGQAGNPYFVGALSNLFEQLELPLAELDVLLTRWGKSAGEQAPTGLQPRYIDQLAWFGLSAQTIETLRPYITILPEPTPVNVNTASEVVLAAMLQAYGLDPSKARSLIKERRRKPWPNKESVDQALPGQNAAVRDQLVFDVKSRYFEVHGRLRLDQTVQTEVLLVKREGTQTRVLSRSATTQRPRYNVEP
jgi:general secretion pathway protein K